MSVEPLSPEAILETLGVEDHSEWVTPKISSEVKERVLNLTGFFPVIDEEAKSVTLLNNDLTVIAHIHPGIFNGKGNAQGIYSRNHLYKDVDDFHLDAGIGLALLTIYAQAGFLFPPEEYTSSIKMIGLLQKFGYVPFSRFEKGSEQVLNNNETDLKSLEHFLLQGNIIKLIHSKK